MPYMGRGIACLPWLLQHLVWAASVIKLWSARNLSDSLFSKMARQVAAECIA